MIEIELLGEDGGPLTSPERYIIELPDGSTREGTLRSGKLRLSGLELEATCKLTFPNLDQEAWEPV